MTGRRGRRRKQLLNDLGKLEDPGNCNCQHQIVLCGELAIEEALDVSQDRQQN